MSVNHTFRGMKKHSTIRIRMVSLAVLIFGWLATFSQLTYTTIADGNWFDDAIWSTDGIDPCYCSPSTDVDSFAVVINHEVIAYSNVQIKDEGTLTVSVSGYFDMSTKELNVHGGLFICDGSAHFDKFTIGNDGYAVFTGPAVVETKFLVLGALDLQFAAYDTFKVMAADVHINPGATVNTEMACIAVYDGDFDNMGDTYFDNASLCVVNGDIINKGMLNFATNTCMTGFGGTFDNKGIVQGSGAVNMDSGNVDNAQGIWSDVEWCATGGGDGLPLAQNCIAADSICALTGQESPLRYQEIRLSLEQRRTGVHIRWTVRGEFDVDHYQVHRSGRNFEFRNIGKVESASGSSPEKTYSFDDRSPLGGTVYYRIATVDNIGFVEYSEIQEISFANEEELALKVYPNPVLDSELFVQVTGIEDTVDGTLALYDPTGQLISSERTEFIPHQVLRVQMPEKIEGHVIVMFWSDSFNLSEVIITGHYEPYN